MGVKDRTELASDEYLSSTNVLEGFAILRKTQILTRLRLRGRLRTRRNGGGRGGGKREELRRRLIHEGDEVPRRMPGMK